MGIYLFHRAEGFYPIGLEDDADAIANAKCNNGTLKVENAITGETVWENKISLVAWRKPATDAATYTE